MENKIRKLLIGFFVVMILFTFLSRAAAATMVAKVQVDHVKSGNLTYEVYGSGIVKAEARKYINLIVGYRIGKVVVQEGQQVKKGDLLFAYDLESLKKKEAELKDELTKLRLQYQNIGLTGQNGESATDEETASSAVINAREDISAAKKELEEQKEIVRKDKEKEYKKAVSDLEDIIDSKKSAMKAAARAVSDAENDLTEQKPELEAKELIDRYKSAVESKDEVQVMQRLTEILEFVYRESYEKHQQEVSDAQKAYERAKEDYSAVVEKWKKIIIDDLDQYMEKSTRNAYYLQLETKREEISNAERAVSDAKEKWDILTEKDNKLMNAANTYRSGIMGQFMDIGNAYTTLYDTMMKDRAADQDNVAKAETKLSRAREDEAQVKEEWNRKVKSVEEEKNQINRDLLAMEAGSYDYTEDLKTEYRALLEAERTLAAAELARQQSKKNDQKADEDQKQREKSDNIERSIQNITITEKEQEWKDLQNLIAEKGKIVAPVAGVIFGHDLEQGITLTGQEKFIITTGGYELAMTADKDDMKYFEAGDEVKITSGAKEDDIITQIENMEQPDQDKMVKFTALLPKGNYQTGSAYDFVLNKDSKDYSMCIPIQALRQDQQGTFVLLVKDMDSVLGKVEEAFRMNVTVLSKDSKSAAIDASLAEEDNVITGSNRNFSEGDRVRIYEEE
jgi:Membrane-fusion protein